MTIDENTGEDIVCPICDSAEYGDCGHLVAIFDKTFCECHGGAFYDRQSDFSNIIEGAFLLYLQNGSQPNLRNATLEDLWKTTKASTENDEDYADLDGYILQRFLIELLEESGAEEAPGALIDPGGPGMTSSICLLFSEQPSEVVDQALKLLAGDLPMSPQDERPQN